MPKLHLDLSKKSTINKRAIKAYYPNLSDDVQRDIRLLTCDSIANLKGFSDHFVENKKRGFIPYPDYVFNNMVNGCFDIGEVEIIKDDNGGYSDVRVLLNSRDTYTILVDKNRKYGGSYLEEGVVNLVLVLSLKDNVLVTGFTDESFAKDYSKRNDIFANV